jgi:hypothetical protein
VLAYGQSHGPSASRPLVRDPAIAPAVDDWPFLYMRERSIPRHYLAALFVVVAVSALSWWATFFLRIPNPNSRTQTAFFFLGAGFMLLETKSIVQFALLWGSTWSSASLAIAAVLVMALASAAIAARAHFAGQWPIGALLLALLVANYLIPVGRVSFSSRVLESVFYAVLVFSPVLCAGLLFSSSFSKSTSTAGDFGANLFGAMTGGILEYMSLLTGYRFLLLLVGCCYVLAIVTFKDRWARRPAEAG